MRIALATLVLASTPVAAQEEDRYSGRYAGDCGPLVCELDIRPIRGGWKIAWTATDPTDFDVKPVCAFETTAEIGSAAMGPAGVVEGIAVGRVRGRPFGIFDLGEGRVSWSSGWEACPGISPKAVYGAFGEQ